MADEHPDETPRKGRSNAILTYETVDNIAQQLVRVNSKLDRLDEKLNEGDRERDDHEVRLRVLERNDHVRSGKSDFGKWLGPILISLIMLGMTVLNYLNSLPA